LSLVDVATSKGDIERRKSYWNTFYCQGVIHTANGRLYGKYCKNRCCTLCCCIRKADIINRYLPVIRNWSQPHFVTLTVKAVSASKLNRVMKAMIRGFKRIIGKYRKKYLRGRGIRLQGIRSLECNFNPEKRTYNPHFHVIVPDQEIANILIREWLQCSKKGWTGPKAQKKSKVHNNQLALIELVKYGSKIFTEPDVNKKANHNGQRKIYAAALDNIFAAMKGLRIFERFGFNLPERSLGKKGSFLVEKYDEWRFNIKYFDWLNENNGKSLSEYLPVAGLMGLLENNIDTVLK